MKFAAPALAATLVALSLLAPGASAAKSVKWYCVALDPAQPWVQTCYPSTSRP